MIYSLTDDSGFLALIDNKKYLSFVNEDLTFEDIKQHFIDQMKSYSLLIWATGKENTWNIDFKNNISDRYVPMDDVFLVGRMKGWGQRGDNL